MCRLGKPALAVLLLMWPALAPAEDDQIDPADRAISAGRPERHHRAGGQTPTGRTW
jgi:hypothetical protein